MMKIFMNIKHIININLSDEMKNCHLIIYFFDLIKVSLLFSLFSHYCHGFMNKNGDDDDYNKFVIDF